MKDQVTTELDEALAKSKVIRDVSSKSGIRVSVNHGCAHNATTVVVSRRGMKSGKHQLERVVLCFGNLLIFKDFAALITKLVIGYMNVALEL
jgi:hypothetical protein